MNTDIRANGADHLTSTNTEPIDVLNESIGKNSARDITRFSSLDPNLMIEIGRNKSLKLFHEASERVPAYSKFLKEHDINPKSIKKYSDFLKVPWTDKENYFKKYSLNDIAWDGKIEKANMIARSSGSSGNPFFWPSDNRQVDEVSYFYENVFRSMFGMPKKSTLVIIAYGMGSWVAGTMSLLAGAKIAEKTNTTFITPGYNRKEVVEIVEKLGFYFEQIVICAYPPLLKEIIDTGLAMELDWTLYNIKYIFGAESISEEFRDYMHEVAGIKSSLMGSMNTIGSADAMVLGHETPVSIAVRRFLGQNDKVKLFNDNRMPTLAQYYPWQKDLFIQEDELILTVNSGVPLIRYNIHDNANIFQYDEINEKLKIAGTSTAKLVESVQSSSVNYDWKLPFVAIYGKSTNAVKFYGAFIYPENIKAALELPHNARVLSGKFLIKVGYDESHNQMIELTLEANMNRDPLGIDITKLKNDIVQTILKLNSEYVAVHNDIGEKSEPIISIVEYGNPNFKYTIKHKYTKD